MANREGRSTTLPLRYIDPAISAMELYASAVIRLLGRTEGNLFLDDFLAHFFLCSVFLCFLFYTARKKHENVKKIETKQPKFLQNVTQS